MIPIRVLAIGVCFLFLSKLKAQNAAFWLSDTVCIGTTISFSYSINVNGSRPKSWSWRMPGATPDRSSSTFSDTSAYFRYTNSGSYRVDLDMVLSNDKDTSIYILLEILPAAPADGTLGADTFYCEPFSRVLDAGYDRAEFLWNTGAQTRRITVNEAGTYSVEVFNRCFRKRLNIQLKESHYPSLDLGPDGSACPAEPKLLNAGTNDYSYRWNIGFTGPALSIDVPGTYSVVKTDSIGCSTRDEIVLADSCPPDLFIPTAFSPNGDRYNPLFKPFTRDIDRLIMEVYNRWGTLVYRSANLDSGWDGTSQGSECPEGVYIWYCRAYDKYGQYHMMKGQVQLIR